MNKLVLSGTVKDIAPLRYTPAGLAVLSFVIDHSSEVEEAGLKRKAMCEMHAMLIGDLANMALHEGEGIKAAGFLAKRSAKSTQLVMHIQQLKKIEV